MINAARQAWKGERVKLAEIGERGGRGVESGVDERGTRWRRRSRWRTG